GLISVIVPVAPSNFASCDVTYIGWMVTTPRLFVPRGSWTRTVSPTFNPTISRRSSTRSGRHHHRPRSPARTPSFWREYTGFAAITPGLYAPVVASATPRGNRIVIFNIGIKIFNVDIDIFDSPI